MLAEVVSSLEHLSTRSTNIGLFRPVGDLVLTKLGVGTKSFVALITGLKLNMSLQKGPRYIDIFCLLLTEKCLTFVFMWTMVTWFFMLSSEK